MALDSAGANEQFKTEHQRDVELSRAFESSHSNVVRFEASSRQQYVASNAALNAWNAELRENDNCKQYLNSGVNLLLHTQRDA